MLLLVCQCQIEESSSQTTECDHQSCNDQYSPTHVSELLKKVWNAYLNSLKKRNIFKQLEYSILSDARRAIENTIGIQDFVASSPECQASETVYA